jgi:hypothetical protein
MLNLFVGYDAYDECGLAPESRDLTTFQSPFGMLHLVTLPMGWMNSVLIFHNDITFILQPEIPNITVPYIDDVPICGPADRYILPNGTEEQSLTTPAFVTLYGSISKDLTTWYNKPSIVVGPIVESKWFYVWKKSLL